MAPKQIYQCTITALLMMCLQVGCNNTGGSGPGESGTCTLVACCDSITLKLLPTNNYLPGQYSAELLFTDNESIIAEFELITIDENNNTSNLMLQVIENESFITSWFMFDEFEDPLEIHYSGRLLSGDFIFDYEFTEEVTVNVKRNGNLLLSKQINPNYDYYWCNYEYGKCDLRQNKEAYIEIRID